MENAVSIKYEKSNFLSEEILIIGPDKTKKGGVATHIQNIITYTPLKNAIVYDLGSIGTTLKNDKSNFLNIFKSLFHLRRMVVDKNYIIFINSSIYRSSFIKLLLILFFLPYKRAQKIIVFFHGGRFDLTFSFFGKLAFLFKPLLKRVKTFYFLSDVQEKGFLNKMGNYPVSLFNNYSDSNNILKHKLQKGNRLNFLFVGRIVQDKGVYELLEAVKHLISKGNNNFHLYIVGDGGEFNNIKKVAETVGISRFISFPGYLEGEDLQEMYQIADWFILPSYHEGFPYVFIEAMRAGVPFITTKTGALARLINQSENGYLIPSKDALKLASLLEKVINSRPDKRMNCYKYFSENLSKEKGEEFYEKLLMQ